MTGRIRRAMRSRVELQLMSNMVEFSRLNASWLGNWPMSVNGAVSMLVVVVCLLCWRDLCWVWARGTARFYRRGDVQFIEDRISFIREWRKRVSSSCSLKSSECSQAAQVKRVSSSCSSQVSLLKLPSQVNRVFSSCSSGGGGESKSPGWLIIGRRQRGHAACEARPRGPGCGARGRPGAQD